MSDLASNALLFKYLPAMGATGHVAIAQHPLPFWHLARLHMPNGMQAMYCALTDGG